MKYRLSLLMFVSFMGGCQMPPAQTRGALPTPALSDFSSDVPPEWISAQLKKDRWGNLHVCPPEQANASDLAIKKRLMEIYSWKAFVALSWPTADRVDQRALDQHLYAQGSGASLGDAIIAALNTLHEASEDNVQVEKLSDSPQYTVGVTRCENGDAKWIPLNGSIWAVSSKFPFRKQNQISASNCPRWMTWHTRQDAVGLQGFTPRWTHRSYCEDNPTTERNTLSISALSDFDHLTDADVPGIQYPLVDQNGNKVFYDVSMNDVSYCTMKRFARHAHDSNPAILDFPTGESDDLGELPGSTELKFAWKVLVPGHDDPRRFITRKVSIPNEGDPKNHGKDCAADPSQCNWKVTQVGLAGMHIVHRSKDHMSWIWSTFEQMDNAPDEDSLVTAPKVGEKFSFYGASPAIVHNTIGPTQLTRTEKIAADTVQLNAEVEQLLKNQHSVLQYYELIGTQYVIPCSIGIEEAVPRLLRNTVIEPYLSQSSSCIRCHSGATLSDSCCTDQKGCVADFSFLAGGLTCTPAMMFSPPNSPTAGAPAHSP